MIGAEPVASDPARTRAGGFARSVRDGWRLGGLALDFVLEQRPLWRYALTAVGAVAASGVIVGALAVILRRHSGPVVDVLAGMGAYYYFTAAITAASVGLAGMVARTFDGYPVTARNGWELVVRRRGAIAGWAGIDLAVGLPSRLIGSWAVDQLIVVVLGFGWALVSLLVIPAIALNGDGAGAAAQRSLRLMRRRWGDAVSGMVYIWLRAVVTIGLPGAAAAAAGVLLVTHHHPFLGGVLVAAGAGALALAALAAITARTVLAVAIFRFADSGTATAAFPEELLDRGVRPPAAVIRRIGRAAERKPVLALRRRILGPEQPSDAGLPSTSVSRNE